MVHILFQVKCVFEKDLQPMLMLKLPTYLMLFGPGSLMIYLALSLMLFEPLRYVQDQKAKLRHKRIVFNSVQSGHFQLKLEMRHEVITAGSRIQETSF